MTSLLNYRIREVNPAGHEFCNNAHAMKDLNNLKLILQKINLFKVFSLHDSSS